MTKEESKVVRVPLTALSAVEKVLGRKSVAMNQVPNVNVRVPVSKIAAVRAAIKKAKS